MAKWLIGILMIAVGASLIVAYFLPVWSLILFGGILLVAAGVFIFTC